MNLKLFSVALIFGLSSFSQAGCPNLTGIYRGETPFGEDTVVVVHQVKCEAVNVGIASESVARGVEMKLDGVIRKPNDTTEWISSYAFEGDEIIQKCAFKIEGPATKCFGWKLNSEGALVMVGYRFRPDFPETPTPLNFVLAKMSDIPEMKE